MNEERIAYPGRRQKFFIVDNIFIDEYLSKAGPYGLMVYLILLRYERRDSRITLIKQKKIATIANISRRTVQRALDDLERVGLLRRTINKEFGDSNYYEISDLSTREAEPVQNSGESAPPDAPDSSMRPNPVRATDAGGASIATSYKEGQEGFSQEDKNSSPPLFEGAEPIKKPRAIPDTIHHKGIALITQLYELGNPGVKCEWVGIAFKRWSEAQKKRPRWTWEQWEACIRNRFASDNINVGDPPEEFIPDLPRYVSGPLNEFNRSKRGNDDRSKRQSPKDRNREARESFVSRLEEASGPDERDDPEDG